MALLLEFHRAGKILSHEVHPCSPAKAVRAAGACSREADLVQVDTPVILKRGCRIESG
jgi:hypothetical protein